MAGSDGYYRCNAASGGNGCTSVKARYLEDYLDSEIQHRRETGRERDPRAPIIPGGDPDERAALISDLRDLEAKLSEIGEAIADGTLSITTASAAERRLVARREDVQGKLSTALPEVAPATYSDLMIDDLHDRWLAGELAPTEVLDLAEMFAAYVERVDVNKASVRGRFNPDRLTIHWR